MASVCPASNNTDPYVPKDLIEAASWRDKIEQINYNKQALTW